MLSAVAQENHIDLPETWEEGPSAQVKTQPKGLIPGVFSADVCGEAGQLH